MAFKDSPRRHRRTATERLRLEWALLEESDPRPALRARDPDGSAR